TYRRFSRSRGSTVALSGFSVLRTPITQRWSALGRDLGLGRALGRALGWGLGRDHGGVGRSRADTGAGCVGVWVLLLVWGLFDAAHHHAAHEVALQEDEDQRSEEHTSELQSRFDLVCRTLLEKK